MFGYRCYEQIDLSFVSQGRVRTAIRSDGQFYCSFDANYLTMSQKLSKYIAV